MNFLSNLIHPLLIITTDITILYLVLRYLGKFVLKNLLMSEWDKTTQSVKVGARSFVGTGTLVTLGVSILANNLGQRRLIVNLDAFRKSFLV